MWNHHVNNCYNHTLLESNIALSELWNSGLGKHTANLARKAFIIAKRALRIVFNPTHELIPIPYFSIIRF